ncbi:MinD/ParA family ATP-binding protein [Microbacterium sp. CPCC 204701]|uniref:MinD/ParA family ATP-binding protein n=1 Tax=Microbacterium sp. CPCC 204701 TaxID=2493084 RepID=UPI000FD715CB|nr:MinD/ParA family protein [Microbacterium sp. CPCC 204701]
MTPDRPDHTPDEPENGVLSDTGSLDTTLGILGGGTAQVNVELPTESDDDLADDDIIGDEVPFVVEIPADADLPVVMTPATEPSAETAEAEIVEAVDSEEWTVEGDGFAAAPATEDIADADEVFEEVGTVASAPAEPAEAEASVDEVESAAVDAAVAEFEDADFDAAQYEDVEFEDVALDDVAPTDVASADVAANEETAEDPMTARTPSDSAPESKPAATDPVPASRREAHHTDAVPTARPADRAVERAFPAASVSLTSKRLGEFEADRETADLLTADRLLDPHQVVRSEPEGMWQHLVYSISGRRINLGDSKRARARKELDRRIAAPLSGGARFVPVLSRKGGVGKTTVTTLLGMALADARDDRVIAVDANPDRGTLAERIARESGKTVRDLVRISGDVVGFNDLSTIVARDETRLDVVASDSDPRVSEAFNDSDYRNVAALAAHYYSVVLTDTGTGIVHSVMGATLDLADQLVIVAGLSVDEARLASETLTWLETNGYSEKVRGAVVVLNNARPGHPLVQLDELEAHFRTRVGKVVRVPYDAQIAAGSGIVFKDLQPATRLAARELAAAVVEGLRSHATAA